MTMTLSHFERRYFPQAVAERKRQMRLRTPRKFGVWLGREMIRAFQRGMR